MAAARVVTFEGVDPEGVESLRKRIEEDGPPEGIPARDHRAARSRGSPPAG